MPINVINGDKYKNIYSNNGFTTIKKLDSSRDGKFSKLRNLQLTIKYTHNKIQKSSLTPKTETANMAQLQIYYMCKKTKISLEYLGTIANPQGLPRFLKSCMEKEFKVSKIYMKYCFSNHNLKKINEHSVRIINNTKKVINL